MPGGLPPEGRIDQALGVFDPQAHREGFGLHRYAQAVQPDEGVPGAVTHGQDHLAGPNPLAIGQQHPAHGMVGRIQIQSFHPLLKTHLAPQGFNAGPEAAHHRGQLEGADVGPVAGEDFGGGAGGHQLFEHLAHVSGRLADLAIELAIGKRPGAPLAELGIGFALEGPFAPPEAKGVGCALLHRLAPLQQQGSVAHLGQHQCTEIATGSGSHHHRGQAAGRGWGRGLGDKVIAVIRGGAQMGVAGKTAPQPPLLLLLQRQLQIQAIDHLNRPTAAGINAAFDQGVADEAGGG